MVAVLDAMMRMCSSPCLGRLVAYIGVAAVGEFVQDTCPVPKPFPIVSHRGKRYEIVEDPTVLVLVHTCSSTPGTIPTFSVLSEIALVRHQQE